MQKLLEHGQDRFAREGKVSMYEVDADIEVVLL